MRDEESIFAEVIGAGPPSIRSAALDRACGGDAELRRRVESLLAAHDKAAGILDATAPGLLCADVPTRTADRVGCGVGPYKLLELIGEGGMGAVYMAEQQKPVRRMVALKLIKPGMDTKQAIARFEAERQALAMMDHANIARVLDAGSTDAGRLYFVMELVKGIPITDYCDHNRLTPRQRLELFAQVCQAVQHAHQKGVIHRDLKPSNVLVTLHDGKPVPKIIDFGIAKATAGNRLTDLTLFTNFSQMLGTPLYMSPEQAELSGLDVDTRSDVYSLGVLLYELLTGTTPFDKQRLGKAAYDEIRRIIREEEPPKPSTRLSTMGGQLTAVSSSRGVEPRRLGQLVRGELDWIVMKALEKDRTRRYESAGALAADVGRQLGDLPVDAGPPSAAYRFVKFARRNRATLATASVVAAALLAGLVVSGVLLRRAVRAERDARQGRDRAVAAEAKERALGLVPLIESHARAGRHREAFDLLRQLSAVIPEDSRLGDLRAQCSWVLTIRTTPPGAAVSRRPPDGDGPWERLGVTPIENARVARGVYEWRFEKSGYATAEGLGVESPLGPAMSQTGGTVRVELDPEAAVPQGMVRVRPLAPGFFWTGQPVELPPYWMDRFEVTNRQYKRFVDDGGYCRRELWEHPFEREGGRLSWEEAMSLLRDTTGAPGPATWARGTYPAGHEDYPVGGVSWYEAAAFAKYAGKTLPSIYHWSGASGRVFLAGEIIRRSNVEGRGPAPVGRFRGMSHCGVYDMAGNVKEWCLNGGGSGKRYALGGAWDEKAYLFAVEDSRPPMCREADVGFRCVKYMAGAAPPPEALGEVAPVARDFLRERKLSDGEFELIKGQFAYDKALPFHATSEVTGRGAEWVHETVSVDAAYGGERLPVHLFVPDGARRPVAAVVYWPGAGAWYQDRVAPPGAEDLLFIIRSGRAVVWPEYKGTYGRKVDPPAGAAYDWACCVDQAKDLGRALDYLASRHDFDGAAVGYYGFSWGAAHALRAVAPEKRIRCAVLADGGLPSGPFDRPEHDPVHYLPRITMPVLMLNGRYDAVSPTLLSQEPMFKLLGADSAHKRLFLSDSGHVSVLTPERVRETLAWFDQYLGPVKWDSPAHADPD